MTEEEAWEIIEERVAKAPPGVQFTEEAMQAAVDRLLGRKPSGEPEPPVQPKPRVSAMAVSSRGLHEKYSPEERAP